VCYVVGRTLAYGDVAVDGLSKSGC
jgi:hypothetical protein